MTVAPFQTPIVQYQASIVQYQMLIISCQLHVQWKIHYVEPLNYHNFSDANNIACKEDGNDGTCHNEVRDVDFTIIDES